ncbi:hypothetical protein ACHHYP_06889 [Achlya hypogyna]|uniref:PDZ domain-containing protein n=1 Tax=Achlya hypogyna TaxID=1202772 RepID=A0A1V9YRH9_ACHHY|nr:hypothetical protein ACHHYP_06889 [Achlya hypogyna]
MKPNICIECPPSAQLGIQLLGTPDSAIALAFVDENGLAHHHGVREGDFLVSINGCAVAGMTAYDAMASIVALRDERKVAFALAFLSAPSAPRRLPQAPVSAESQRRALKTTYDVVWSAHDGPLSFMLGRSGHNLFVVRNLVADARATTIGVKHVRNGDVLVRVNGAAVTLGTTPKAWATKPCVLRFRRPLPSDKAEAAANMMDAIKDFQALLSQCRAENGSRPSEW